jgi:serine protease Do
VEQGTPADKAGLEAGDIITKVDGKAVDKAADLPRIIGAVKPGTRTTLQLFRKGAYRDVTLTVAELDAQAQTRAASEPKGAATKGALGLSVADLNEATRRELRIKGGVRVEAADGAAARAGVREGDIILSLDNVDVSDARHFAALAAKLDRSKRATLLVRRGEWVNYLVIPAGR